MHYKIHFPFRCDGCGLEGDGEAKIPDFMPLDTRFKMVVNCPKCGRMETASFDSLRQLIASQEGDSPL